MVWIVESDLRIGVGRELHVRVARERSLWNVSAHIHPHPSECGEF